MLSIARASGRPVSVGLTQARQYPDVWRDSFARIERATAPGIQIVPQVAPRSIGLMLGMDGLLSPLLLIPAAGELLDKSHDELRVLLQGRALRRRLAESLDPSGEIMAGMATLDRLFPVTEPGVASYETTPERSVAGIAKRRGVLPGEVILDELLASDFKRLFLIAIYNFDMDGRRRDALASAERARGSATPARTRARRATSACRRSCSRTGCATAARWRSSRRCGSSPRRRRRRGASSTVGSSGRDRMPT
jgi:N-acyl-D-aspartate/D-glutamate deacylase